MSGKRHNCKESGPHSHEACHCTCSECIAADLMSLADFLNGESDVSLQEGTQNDQGNYTVCVDVPNVGVIKVLIPDNVKNGTVIQAGLTYVLNLAYKGHTE